eukprot:4351810-Alexandrium_andersonii.AAC.2
MNSNKCVDRHGATHCSCMNVPRPMRSQLPTSSDRQMSARCKSKPAHDRQIDRDGDVHKGDEPVGDRQEEPTQGHLAA